MQQFAWLASLAGPLACAIYDEGLGEPRDSGSRDGATGRGGRGGSTGGSGSDGTGAGGETEGGVEEDVGGLDRGGAGGMGGAAGRGGIDAAVDGNPSDANRADAARPDTDALVPDAPGLDVSADVGTIDALTDRGGEPGVDAAQDSWVPDGVVADINTGIDADPDRRGSSPDGGPIVGVYYNIIAQHSGKCMTVLGNLPFDGTNIVQFACDGSSSQRFRLQAVTTSSYIIVHPFSSKCVDVAESGTADGTNVNLYTCNNTTAQLYGLKLTESPGFYTIVNPNSGKCVDVDGARQADLANIQIFTCNGALNQAWEFIDVTKDQ